VCQYSVLSLLIHGSAQSLRLGARFLRLWVSSTAREYIVDVDKASECNQHLHGYLPCIHESKQASENEKRMEKDFELLVWSMSFGLVYVCDYHLLTINKRSLNCQNLVSKLQSVG
jgi:hypothetical protein